MFKILKELNEYKANKDRYKKFKSEELDYIQFDAEKEDYASYKQLIAEYKRLQPQFHNFLASQVEYGKFLENQSEFDNYLELQDDFVKYANAIGDGTRPFFLMYASEIDREGNISLNYDFDQKFVDLLRQQGINGIGDLDVVEAYLHYIFSQNYFTEMLIKTAKDEDKQEPKKD